MNRPKKPRKAREWTAYWSGRASDGYDLYGFTVRTTVTGDPIRVREVPRKARKGKP